MTPIDIQVSRSKVKVKGQAYSLYVGEGGGGLVFYKHLYFKSDLINSMDRMRISAKTLRINR